MALPKLSDAEKRKALEKAQLMRSKRAELRAKLKSGSISLQEVLESKDDEVVAKCGLPT